MSSNVFSSYSLDANLDFNLDAPSSRTVRGIQSKNSAVISFFTTCNFYTLYT